MSKQYVRVGGWRIDLDQVPAAIKIFNDALDKAEKLTARAKGELQVEAMGGDDVSTGLAVEVNKRHLGGQGSTAWATERFRDELVKAVAQLESARRHYARVESASRQVLGGHG
ncbi:hypothetical protein NLX83_02025 [Allokutzneria sp. A3M-2-11 16]|uniref:hypothetical protein n=1 Tax=Allokutzneria sp. A3M-2-11 16 TaxID=2962043 RepID=UPI0020B6DD17|nr:hypothetical protein [Allokutzneria sp. A3M-2-11 16]MCP3798027.1 hypothetical protein [Allokutzneria sp. A3M-2-11 16]